MFMLDLSLLEFTPSEYTLTDGYSRDFEAQEHALWLFSLLTAYG